MKYIKLLVYFCIILPVISFSQGSTCSNPHVLQMDGVCRNFNTSSSTGGNLLCTDIGNTPVTWFSFTTNSTPDNVLINITDPSGQPAEIMMYTACNGSNPFNIGSSMCFEDGKGIWAPEELFNLSPNTTYMLRVKTTSATTLTICAKNYTPVNDDCSGAISISDVPVTDNNAAHKAGPGVWASDVCASTLENTAFYSFYVLNTGSTIVNISNILCDNGNGNNNSGFQIGFFTGNCSGLVPFYCTSGSGSVVQATSPPLNAGTKVTLAIDGYAGSNCQYDIQAVNGFVLATTLKKFTIWKKSQSNLLTWNLENEKSSMNIEIQRSEDGISFKNIATLKSNPGNEVMNSFDYNDVQPFPVSYYRLLLTDVSGKMAMSETIMVKRINEETLKLHFSNTVRSQLIVKIESPINTKYDVIVTGANGIVFYKDALHCQQGITSYVKDLHTLRPGKYFFTIKNDQEIKTESFIKL